MIKRRALRAGIVVWAIIGLLIGLASLRRVNPDVRVLGAVATVIFPLSAFLASTAIASRRDRTAGLLLLVSVATPTYFAWIVNVPALLAGLALVLGVPLIAGRSSSTERLDPREIASPAS